MRLALTLLALTASAAAQRERDYQATLCQGWEIEHTLPDGARVDCLSDAHAIEIDFSDKWAEGIGQALFYGAQTGLGPGLILVCRQQLETCQGHLERALSVVEAYDLPLSVWACEAGARRLEECEALYE